MEKREQPKPRSAQRFDGQKEWAGRHEMRKRLWGEKDRKLRKALRRHAVGDADETIATAEALEVSRLNLD